MSTGPVPLSHSQQRFLLDEGLAPGQDDNQVVLPYLLTGPVDPAALAAAFDDVVRRHPGLRSVFRWDGDLGPVQEVLPFDPVRTPLVATPVADPSRPVAETAAALCADWWRQPFDLEEEPPLRARLGRLDDERWLLCLSLHHIVFDGRSEQVLLDDLGAAYAARAAGRQPDLPPVPGFHDYARWEAQHVAAWKERDLPFWRDMLGGECPRLLPAAAQEQAPRRDHEVVLDPAAVEGVLAAVREARALPLAAVLCGTAHGLERAFGADRLHLATISSGRFERAFHSVVGCFVNPIVLPMAADGREPAEFVRATGRAVFQGLRHARTPFDEVVRAVRPGGAQDELWSAMVAFQLPTPGGRFGGDGIGYRPVRVAAPRAGAGLLVEVEPSADGAWSVAARWREDLVAEAAGRRVVEGLAEFLTTLA
ncbi:condensation domain-containing protein [Streptomyces sp. TLI_235]|nr:condensation domain-containing protein [Streptomyces sp. TLI_235]PBC78948.1 condensation domain-containing protein [Streptomyces sp. TLI_235]